MIFNNEYLNYAFTIVVTIIIAFIFSRILRKIFNKYIQNSTESLHVDVTNYNFLKNAINFVIFIAATIFIFYSIPALRDIGVTLLASAGIFAAIIGFASQQAFSNIISGIFIVIFKPFRVGDQIKIKDDLGIIEDITLRHTIIRNFENRRVLIPNSTISSETILNSTISDPSICVYFEVGVSYDADVNKAIAILQEEAIAHPNFVDKRTDEDKQLEKHPIIVRMLGYGESSINLRAYIWAKDSGSGFIMKCDLYKSVKERFDNEGIEIPFPYRTLVMKDKIKGENDDKKVWGKNIQ